MTDTPEFKRTKLTRDGGTAVLALASDKVNALDKEVFHEITSFVEYCEGDPTVTALVLTGEGSLFSAGLNVTDVLANDKGYTESLLQALDSALVSLFRCSKPTVAAINGSAIAGGCLLAIACDKRLISDAAKIGVTELKVGVAFPIVAVELITHVCGTYAEPLMFDAALLNADDAQRYGLVHGQFPREDLDAAALKAASKLGSLDAKAYGLAKATSRRAALAAMEDKSANGLSEQVLEHWQDDRTRANLELLLKPKS